MQYAPVAGENEATSVVLAWHPTGERKSNFTVHAVVTDSDGVVVAETEGLYQLRALGK